MNKLTQKLILAAIVTTSLTACLGGGGSGSSSSTTTTPTTTTTTTPAIPTPTVSTLLNVPTVTSPTGTVSLRVTLSNNITGAVAFSGGALTIPLPTGGKTLSSYSVGAPCSATSFSVGSSLVLAGITIPMGATCFNDITLTPSTPGTFVFTPTGLTSMSAGTTATLTIN